MFVPLSAVPTGELKVKLVVDICRGTVLYDVIFVQIFPQLHIIYFAHIYFPIILLSALLEPCCIYFVIILNPFGNEVQHKECIF